SSTSRATGSRRWAPRSAPTRWPSFARATGSSARTVACEATPAAWNASSSCSATRALSWGARGDPPAGRLPSQLGLYQPGDRRVPPHLVQVAAAVRADAADRDAQPRADVSVGQRRVGDKQGDQLLAVRRQLVERLAQRGLALGREQALVGQAGPLV